MATTSNHALLQRYIDLVTTTADGQEFRESSRLFTQYGRLTLALTALGTLATIWFCYKAIPQFLTGAAGVTAFVLLAVAMVCVVSTLVVPRALDLMAAFRFYRACWRLERAQPLLPVLQSMGYPELGDVHPKAQEILLAMIHGFKEAQRPSELPWFKPGTTAFSMLTSQYKAWLNMKLQLMHYQGMVESAVRAAQGELDRANPVSTLILDPITALRKDLDDYMDRLQGALDYQLFPRLLDLACQEAETVITNRRATTEDLLSAWSKHPELQNFARTAERAFWRYSSAAQRASQGEPS